MRQDGGWPDLRAAAGPRYRAQGLLHCVNLVKPLWLIAGTELAGTVRDAEVDLARSNIAVGFVGHAGGTPWTSRWARKIIAPAVSHRGQGNVGPRLGDFQG